MAKRRVGRCLRDKCLLRGGKTLCVADWISHELSLHKLCLRCADLANIAMNTNNLVDLGANSLEIDTVASETLKGCLKGDICSRSFSLDEQLNHDVLLIIA